MEEDLIARKAELILGGPVRIPEGFEPPSRISRSTAGPGAGYGSLVFSFGGFRVKKPISSDRGDFELVAGDGGLSMTRGGEPFLDRVEIVPIVYHCPGQAFFNQLLEQKRTILLLELMGKIREAKDLQRSLEDVFSKAYFSLQMAGLSLGIENVEELSYSVPETNDFTIRLHSVMGVEIPKVDPVEKPPQPCYSFLGTSGTLDSAYLHASEVLSLIARLAEVETSVYRLAVQIRRTFRRVNALEKVVIPYHKKMLAWISNVLEENDREDFTRMKIAREETEREGGWGI